ncbi:flocculation protein FLO11-like, partial [Fagus crenata]
DLDIDLTGDDGVETTGAQTELAPIAGVETHNDSICDDVIIVPPHASPTTHDSLGIELSPMIESTKVVEPATIAGRLAEELSRPFNSDDYFAGLGAFLDTMRPSYVGPPMIRDKFIAHVAPINEEVVDPNNLALILHGGTPATVSGDKTSSNDSEGLRGGLLDQDAQDPYDDMDDNLVVREVPAPFSSEAVDTSSSSGEGIEVSPTRGDDLDLTLKVPYSRLHGFKFGCDFDSFYLCWLSGMLCDMRRTPLELVTERKLQDWRGVAKELIDLGFAVDFLLERICEVARMYFGRKTYAEAEAINAQIAYHKEHIIQLEAKKNGLPLVVPLGNLFAGCVLTHGLID